MNRKQRAKNRATFRWLRDLCKKARLSLYKCENCGEMGGHWVTVKGISLEGILSGVDDSVGFYRCQKSGG